MKKIFAFSAATLALATVAVAGNSVAELNQEIQQLLAPFNNAVTKTSLAFNTISTNEERALAVGLSAFYEKLGSQNTVSLKIDNLSYAYGDGSAPTTQAKASLGLDLTKLLPQEELNRMVPDLERIIVESTKGLTQEYGEAVTVEAVVTGKQQDAAGNYVGLQGSLTFSIDLAKLPEGKTADSVMFRSGRVALDVGTTKGVAFDLTLVSNPGYTGFQRDQKGLKEYLDMLLARDPELLKQFSQFAAQLDGFAGGIVNGRLF